MHASTPITQRPDEFRRTIQHALLSQSPCGRPRRARYAAAGAFLAAVLALAWPHQSWSAAAKTPSMDEVLAASTAAEWRALDPENTVYLELTTGRVVIELAPRFAPAHVNNIRVLVRAGFFDGQSINRVQDNFVAQWGDAEQVQRFGMASKTLDPEFTVKNAASLPFDAIADRDGWAAQSGFVESFPAGRTGPKGEAWLAHCYGMVGAGRNNDLDSGNGAELYAVIGQSPRALDRNIALVGRVVQGMEFLASLPRGHEALGFYGAAEPHAPILKARMAADLPANERIDLEVLRSDSTTFKNLVAARRNRHDDFYRHPPGHIDLCNVPIPVRTVARRP